MIAYAVTPPAVPMMSADWLLLTVLVETGKLALVAPPGTVTLGGTVAAVVLSLDKATERPPAPAGAVSVTVPVAGSPPTTSVGLTFTVDSAGAASAGAARIPAPMTISTPMTARRDSLRCRVDVVNRLVRMEDLLSVGRPPRCGGRASWGHTQPYVERVSGRGEADSSPMSGSRPPRTTSRRLVRKTPRCRFAPASAARQQRRRRYRVPCNAAARQRPQNVSRGAGRSACAPGACGEFELADGAVREPEFVPQCGDLFTQPFVLVE